MRRLILRTEFTLGDVVMMTAAVRDLHGCYRGQFATDVRTHYPEVWENNPYITYIEDKDPEAEAIDCSYSLINYANSRPYHCLHGYVEHLNTKLRVQIRPMDFKGDIHLAREETEWASQVHELTGRDTPFWIVSAGGKYDLTTKWWSTSRFQRVVDHFKGRIAFVQIGEFGHHHPKLQNTIDLRGKTSVRELIRLVHHAQGCLCPVTALMHLAAAVKTRADHPRNRPCVVIAGGREPPNWEAYPHHQYLHTVGALPCCSQGGCWKSRVIPLNDGDSRDKPANLCSDVAGDLPHCMAMITPEEVIRKISAYFEGGMLRYLTPAEARATDKGIRASLANTYDLDSLNRYNSPQAIARVVQTLPEYPGGFQGRGIVICAGGLRYFPCAWVCVNMLRHAGCKLPIQVWYLGKTEMDARMISLLERLEVECIDAQEVEKKFPRRASGGWELKTYAIIHSPFREVLFLDSDNVPIADPTYLFEEAKYKETGSVFWPDYGSLGPKREIWAICDVPYREEPEFESGQILVDKRRCWRALNLAVWFNEHSDFFFQYIHGDKDTCHMAWRKLSLRYTMIPTPIESLDGIMCQHDFNGRRLFQHRNSHKWRAFAENVRVEGFLYEDICLNFLKRLEDLWDGRIHLELDNEDRDGNFIFRKGTCDQSVYHSVCEKNDYELPEQFRSNEVIIDVGAHIGSFSFACLKRGARRVRAFEPDGQNFRIAQHNLYGFKRAVRLYQKAVWRSDRHEGLLLHSGYLTKEHEVDTGGGTVLLRAEKTSSHKPKEIVGTISLDKLLRRFTKVHLLKLDCEGSEWPILFTSKLLSKVEKICGEYHELKEIPAAAQVPGYHRYTKKELEAFLKTYYRRVRIQPHSSGKRGLFWAEN